MSSILHRLFRDKSQEEKEQQRLEGRLAGLIKARTLVQLSVQDDYPAWKPLHSIVKQFKFQELWTDQVKKRAQSGHPYIECLAFQMENTGGLDRADFSYDKALNELSEDERTPAYETLGHALNASIKEIRKEIPEYSMSTELKSKLDGFDREWKEVASTYLSANSAGQKRSQLDQIVTLNAHFKLCTIEALSEQVQEQRREVKIEHRHFGFGRTHDNPLLLQEKEPKEEEKAQAQESWWKREHRQLRLFTASHDNPDLSYKPHALAKDQNWEGNNFARISPRKAALYQVSSV